MRRQVGKVLISVLSVGKFIAGLIIALFVLGFWWQIIKAILDSPISALWLIPLGIIMIGFATFIMKLVYNYIAMPMVALTVWLLKDSENP